MCGDISRCASTLAGLRGGSVPCGSVLAARKKLCDMDSKISSAPEQVTSSTKVVLMLEKYRGLEP